VKTKNLKVELRELLRKTTAILWIMKGVFSKRGIFYILTRFGGSSLRRRALDCNYVTGGWDLLDKERSPEMTEVVKKYIGQGDILELGCGVGTLADTLGPEAFKSYVGVDASREAISKALRTKNAKMDFVVGDIQSYKCKRKYDLIIFEESLYYVNPFFRRRVLKKNAQHLKDNGLFIVTVADPQRFAKMIRMICKNFEIAEKRHFSGSDRLLLVFH